jgi:hypothetical protein
MNRALMGSRVCPLRSERKVVKEKKRLTADFYAYVTMLRKSKLD